MSQNLRQDFKNKVIDKKNDVDLNSYYQVPRWVAGIRRSMSKASIDIQDYIFYQFSNEWAKDYGVFFVSRLAKDLDYSENTIRKGLKECFDKKIFLVHDMKIEGKLIFKNTIDNQMLLTDILEGRKIIDVDLKSSIKITDKNSIIPFKKSNVFSLKSEGYPFKNEVPPFKIDAIESPKNEGVPLTVVEGKQMQTEGLKPIQSIDIKESQDTHRKNYVIENNIYIEKEVSKEVNEVKQISDLSKKEVLFITYKNLRKNDPEYLELLKTVCDNTSEEVLKDWLDARPFLETQGNIPYYLLNSIQNQRPLPQAYLSKKSEKIKTELFDRWSGVYEKIAGRKINFSMIENNLCEMVSNIIKVFEFTRNYINSKDFEYKCNESNIRQVKVNQEFLQDVCKVLKVSQLQELIRTVLKTDSLKKRNRFLLDLKNVDSIISSIVMINDYASREV